MKKLLIMSFLVQSLVLLCQKNIKVYYEQRNDTVAYYADNPEIYPVSIVFSSQPELENMRKSEAFRITQVLPPKSVKNKVIYFVANDNTKRWKVKYMPGYSTFVGNVTLQSYDYGYQYNLPFQKGKAFNVFQGYNGTFSHQNENSLDFTMPEGTEVTAAREGMVIQVVQNNNTGCPTVACVDLANYISILHSDGTIAQYFHLKQNGVKVSIGDNVKKGDVIGLSGNTGWTSGPHLHFVCFLPSSTRPKQRVTVKTLFATGDGKQVEYLTEKKTYSRNY